MTAKNMAATPPPGVPPARLDPDAVYRAPSGRLCRLAGMDKRGPPGEEATAHLAYVREAAWALNGSRLDDGFSLSRENWRILKVVAYAAAR